jgi:hypothetical protein
MNNLIANKSVAILDAPRRNLNTQCVKISLLPNVKSFQKHYDSVGIMMNFTAYIPHRIFLGRLNQGG